MGTAVMMYVLPMLLGQTYDMGKEKIGLPIYANASLEKAKTIEQYFTDSQYRMIDNSDDVKDFLDISGKLSLKIKAGMLDVSGEGSYLKDSSSKSNGMEILVKVHFETVTRTIPYSVEPIADWRLLSSKYLGTHYCRSITYGGDLIASIRINADNTYDMEKIKGSVNVGANGGSFSAEVKARLEKLKSDLQDSSSMEINYYASVPIHGVTYTLDGLMKLIDNFPAQVKKVNKGLGNPLRMELVPLSLLEPTYAKYLENRALEDILSDLEDQFDDLRSTRKATAAWISGLPPLIPAAVETKIHTFIDKINNIYGIYLKTIDELDVSKNASTQPLAEAVETYRSDGNYVIPEKYTRQMRNLQKNIYNEAPELKPRIGGALYVHWGRRECDSNITETAVSGVTSASQSVQRGGSSDYVCAPVIPKEADPKDYFPGYDPEDYEESNLLIGPLRYLGTMARFKNMAEKAIACAVCRAPLRTTVFMKPADTKCPTDKWVKEYEGYLMAPGFEHLKGQYICIDKNMQEPRAPATFGTSEVDSWAKIEEVTVQCGGLPCAPYQAGKPIPCVVCSI